MSKSKKTIGAAGSHRITRLEFCASHYCAEQLPTDMFYVEVANRIYPLIHKVFSAQPGCTPAISRRMAVTLASYLEDLVAGTCIWAAFTSLYRKKYGGRLPFFDMREQDSFISYDDELPSFHAVLFLLWYVANDINPCSLLNPNNQTLRLLAMTIAAELKMAYDKAPDTPGRMMLMPEDEIGIPLFYQIRNLCAWLSERCYLTRIIDKEQVTSKFSRFLNTLFNATGKVDKDAKKYAIDSYVPMNALIGPLAIPAYEWLAEIVSLSHEPEEEEFIPVLAAVKSRRYEFYKYESVGQSELVLKDQNGELLTLSASSMPGERFSDEVKPGRSALMSIVLVDGVWLMNGIGLQGLPGEQYDEFCRLRNTKKEEFDETYKYLFKAFGKKRIGVCGSYEEYIKLAYGDDTPRIDPNTDPDLIDDIRDAGNLLYFLNTDSTVSILPGWATCVKIKGNPYYDSEDSALEGISLIMNHSLTSAEMREYIIKHKLIPDAAMKSMISPEDGRQMFQRSMSFLNDYVDRDTMPYMADF